MKIILALRRHPPPGLGTISHAEHDGHDPKSNGC
jgi:hypothetical protein